MQPADAGTCHVGGCHPNRGLEVECVTACRNRNRESMKRKRSKVRLLGAPLHGHYKRRERNGCKDESSDDCQKTHKDGADVAQRHGSSFQTQAAATRKARSPTVGNLVACTTAMMTTLSWAWIGSIHGLGWIGMDVFCEHPDWIGLGRVSNNGHSSNSVIALSEADLAPPGPRAGRTRR